MKDVENFIKIFQCGDSSYEMFRNDGCYWFAYILFRRFIEDGSKIMYSFTKEHFGTQIGSRVYDITGDVTDKYVWAQWTKILDTESKNEIKRKYITI